MMWGSGWGGGIVGVAMMLLFWGALVLLVVIAFRWGTDNRRGGSSSRTQDARAILEERLARGEISADESEQRRKVLGHTAR